MDGAVTLHQYFRDNLLNLPEEEIRSIFKRVANGIKYLHQQGISHREIKPDNILLSFDEDGFMVVKIIDFGFATSNPKADLQCGTPNFMAPELSDKAKKYSP